MPITYCVIILLFLFMSNTCLCNEVPWDIWDNPRFFIEIQNGYAFEDQPRMWFTTWSYAENTYFIAQRFSVLHLKCVSPFPIIWQQNYNGVSSAIEHGEINSFTWHKSLDPGSKWWRWRNFRHGLNASYGFQAKDNLYEADLSFINVTTDINAVYYCTYPDTPNELSHSIHIEVDTSEPVKDSKLPKILVNSINKQCFSNDQPVSISLQYFSPAGLLVSEYLSLPNSQKVLPNIQPHGFIRHLDTQINYTNGEGTYQMCLEWRSDNGTKVQVIHAVEVVKCKMSYLKTAIRQVDINRYEASLTAGQTYLIRYEDMSGHIDLSAHELQFYSSQLTNGTCSIFPVDTKRISELCGLIGAFYRLNEENRTMFTLTVKVSKPCKIFISNWLQSINGSRQFLQSQLEILPQGKSITLPSIVSTTPLRSQTNLLVKETLILKCIVQLCKWQLIAWCKRGSKQVCSWVGIENWNQSGRQKFLNDASIQTSISVWEGYGFSFNLIFTSLRKEHSGVYDCYVYKHDIHLRPLSELYRIYSRTPENVIQLPFVSKRVQIFDPTKPVLMDKWGSEKLEYKISDGKAVALSCKTEGYPEADIFWEKLDSLNHSSFHRLHQLNNLTVWNTTECAVFRCTTQNAHGITTRAFMVTCQSNYSVTVVIVASLFVGNVIIIGIIVLAIRYRKRNAVEVLS